MEENKHFLLNGFNDALRTMPTELDFFDGTPGTPAWIGRVGALTSLLQDVFLIADLKMALTNIQAGQPQMHSRHYQRLSSLLHQAAYQLQIEVSGPTSIALDTGKVYTYFNVVSKEISAARKDILIIDPYLNHEVVDQYFSYIADGVSVRLLTTHNISQLKPAVEAFAKQHKLNIEIRKIKEIHDRYIFVDGKRCYQSGASFKDGARNAPTIIAQITDAFEAMKTTYEELWLKAKII